MIKTATVFLAVIGEFATAAFAKEPRTKLTAAHDLRQDTPTHIRSIPDSCRAIFVGGQDLFDRNNPNNLRTDYPSPPAQPAQF
ncbi:hypothetical protein ACQR1W_23335 [Bradyrhizobium sp. HKCCYLS1011]|uniref:hypothetical protein n=1 Tax=Bradyrhizobium sp. HKCCYLS1011 TaxID=3420733 RepID=UPI003EC028DB